jgi:hypothetical protein
MIRPTLFFVVAIGFVACNSEERSLTPTLPSQGASSPSSQATGVLRVGQEIMDTFIGNPRIYELTAPSGGTLVTRLTWDPTVQGGAKLMLTIGQCAMPGAISLTCPSAVQFMNSAPNWSPLVGRVAVSAGRTYRVIVEEGAAPWDYDFRQPFVLNTAIESGSPWDY